MIHTIIDYLTQKYHPKVFILYGSYADGSNNAGSDFDALLISKNGETCHDTAIVDGVQLDVFVYTPDEEFDPAEIVQLYHGKLLIDEQGRGRKLLDSVKAYIDAQPLKTPEEVKEDIVWCEKMLCRIRRQDAEGFYRWHWVLCDSLEIFCSACKRYYFGPKKTLLWMEREEPVAFKIYKDALSSMDQEKLENWVNCLRGKMEG